MSANAPALIAAAAGVGFGHAILPDHWVPLAVVGRTQQYRLRRVARLSGLAGVAHVAVSLTLGAVIVAVGLQFRSTVASAQDAIVGALLLLTGVAFGVVEISGRGHAHAHHEHSHDHRDSGHTHGGSGGSHAPGRAHRLAAVMIPFGAAASPDLTILPVFIAATAAGAFAAIGSLVVFSAVTVGTIVSLTLLACFGGRQLQARWLDRWGNLFTAGVLVAIGVLVVTGTV